MNWLKEPLNCAGHQCPERKTCKRFRSRIGTERATVGEHEVTVLQWASFDVERVLFGNCSARIQVQVKH